jgi:plastocyanin
VRRPALVLVVGALAVAGCGGDDDEGENGSPRESAQATETDPAERRGGTTVDMNDQLTFVPKRIEVSVGEEVTWRNVGKVGHTVTADRSKAADPSLVSIPAGTRPWDSGFVMEGQSFSRRFDKPGTYRYICIPHEGAGMVGTVMVR